jgi:4-alpha-glucanotransferase
MQFPRSSGVLLHVTSLPGPHGIGDLGREAYRFVDFLARAGQRYWQVLPLVPLGHGHSPYSSPSTFASNPLLISFGALLEDDLIDAADIEQLPGGHVDDDIDYASIIPARLKVLDAAYHNFKAGRGKVEKREYGNFLSENADWLDDYAIFMALKDAFADASWVEWPSEFAARDDSSLAEFRRENVDAIERHCFWQYLFSVQWDALKAYSHRKGVQIFGDLPIYVAHDSADVWSHRELFYLDDDGNPSVVAGVPPDYFSETGQRWGNPLYRWDLMQENDYQWWRRRLSKILERVDIVRLDHFRAFAAYWEIPASEETAIEGQWVDGPSDDFFRTMQRQLGDLPVVAEDLGLITDDVTALMNRFGFPGMAVYQFGFDSGPESTFLPHNFKPNLVAYTGTHDNDTLRGWWEANGPSKSAEEKARTLEFVRHYLDLDRDDDFARECVRTLLASVAHTSIIPVQDILGLGSDARMNTPGLAQGNWTWRMKKDALTMKHADQLRRWTETYDRLRPAYTSV